uniref:Uncharacterized protein n=1 Tax=Romanomermis culicivorax TaxID=13658 RepID=A0A915KJV6_ROMCU
MTNSLFRLHKRFIGSCRNNKLYTSLRMHNWRKFGKFSTKWIKSSTIDGMVIEESGENLSKTMRYNATLKGDKGDEFCVTFEVLTLNLKILQRNEI